MSWKNWISGLDIPEGRSGDCEIVHEVKPAGTTLSTGNLRTALFGQPSEKITFPEETHWHILREVGRGTWMSDFPIEQAQHRSLLEGMHGEVLVGGLGLGMAAQWLAASPGVSRVIVVEVNSDIIRLVQPHLDSKVRVVQQDLSTYLLEAVARDDDFDWCFFDIWQSDSEKTFWDVVCPLREDAHDLVPSQLQIRCWNEDVMRGQLLLGLQTQVSIQLGLLPMPKMSLDTLSTYRNDKYWDWKVPFWQYAKKEGLPAAAELTEIYVRNVGLPRWGATWAKLCRS